MAVLGVGLAAWRRKLKSRAMEPTAAARTNVCGQPSGTFSRGLDWTRARLAGFSGVLNESNEAINEGREGVVNVLEVAEALWVPPAGGFHKDWVCMDFVWGESILGATGGR